MGNFPKMSLACKALPTIFFAGILLLVFQNCSGSFHGVDSVQSNIATSSIEVPSMRIGLGEPLLADVTNNGWDLNSELAAVIALKPQVFRMWMNASDLLIDPLHINTARAGQYSQAISALQNSGVTVFGMDSDFPTWMTGVSEWGAIPCRSSPLYADFLVNYENTKKTLAAAFPLLTAWEPANETNGDTFLHPPATGVGSCSEQTFTLEEKAAITVDLMYRAHRAIKLANPNAIVFMPPVAPVDSSGNVDVSLQSISAFISLLYTDIASGAWPSQQPRDYFDGASWHPYIFQDATTSSWIATNQAVYQTLVAHGDGAIPIIFSEIGNTDSAQDPALLATWMDDTLSLSQQNLPWLTWIVWFRAFNDPSAQSWGGESQVDFGIMGDGSTGFAWKPSAATFCKYTGCREILVPIGNFKINENGVDGVFYSNGNAYCSYSSPQNFTALTSLAFYPTLAVMPEVESNEVLANVYSGACE